MPWPAPLQKVLFKLVQLCVALALTMCSAHLWCISVAFRLQNGITFRSSIFVQLYPGQTVPVSALNNFLFFFLSALDIFQSLLIIYKAIGQ